MQMRLESQAPDPALFSLISSLVITVVAVAIVAVVVELVVVVDKGKPTCDISVTNVNEKKKTWKK